MNKVKLFIIPGVLICASIGVATYISSNLSTQAINYQATVTQQASLKSEMQAKVDYPMIKNSDFIASLVVNGVISREKLEAYYELLNIPQTATFDLAYAKSYDDGLFEFTLAVSPWQDETGTEVTSTPWMPQLQITLLPPNYVPPKADFMWLWILIAVVGAIAAIFITAIIIQRSKDIKQFPYVLKLG